MFVRVSGCVSLWSESALPSIFDLTNDLHRLGLARGDAVMIHASLRAVGPVEERAAGVVRALDEAVGTDGTLLMYIGARDDWGWVNHEPEASRAGLLQGTPPFDPDATAADPENGVLAEVFRQMPGTLVSNHPEGRFAARGRLADMFVRDAPWDDYYGPGSALQRLVDAHGKVLRLGADRGTVTLLHFAEYLAKVPQKRCVRRHRIVMGLDGPDLRTVDCLDDEHGIVDYPGGDYFEAILAAYLETHGAPAGQVGRAHSELLDAGDFLNFGVRWMTDHLSVAGPVAGSDCHI